LSLSVSYSLQELVYKIGAEGTPGTGRSKHDNLPFSGVIEVMSLQTLCHERNMEICL
jgi:hypothetical protein